MLPFVRKFIVIDSALSAMNMRSSLSLFIVVEVKMPKILRAFNEGCLCEIGFTATGFLGSIFVGRLIVLL